MDPDEEAALWLKQEGAACDLCTFVVRRGDSLDGVVCASLCVRGRHERHRDGGPKVAFDTGRGRKRARSGSTSGTDVAVAAEVMIWHLWVRPEARRRRWAQRLFEAVRAHARAEIGGGPGDRPLRFACEVLCGNSQALSFWRHVLGEGATEEPADEYVHLSAVLGDA